MRWRWSENEQEVARLGTEADRATAKLVAFPNAAQQPRQQASGPQVLPGTGTWLSCIRAPATATMKATARMTPRLTPRADATLKKVS
jgi:hypothetical protein